MKLFALTYTQLCTKHNRKPSKPMERAMIGARSTDGEANDEVCAAFGSL